VRDLLTAAVLAGLAVLAVAVLAGCSTAASAGATGTSCGKTRTGVNVPVAIMAGKGTVNCATALRVEQGYAAAIGAGDLRGNGGGAPATVDGWTWECHTASAEVVSVLPLPSFPSSASTGS